MTQLASRPHIRTARSALGRLLVVGALIASSTAAYTVRPGDSLWSISRRTGVSVRSLASANGVRDPDVVRIGARLSIPAGGSVGAASGGARHTVRAGQTLSGIAGRYGISTAALAGANGLADADRVRAGAVLRVPTGGGGGAATSGGSGSRAGVEQLLETTAQRYGWNPTTVKALAWQESGWQQRVVSPDGAVGIMQVLPSTGRFVSRYIVGRELDLRDPADNVEAGVAFLDYVHGLTGGDLRRTLGGYYQGLRSMDRNGVYDDTVRYTDNVLALRRRFG